MCLLRGAAPGHTTLSAWPTSSRAAQSEASDRILAISATRLKESNQDVRPDLAVTYAGTPEVGEESIRLPTQGRHPFRNGPANALRP